MLSVHMKSWFDARNTELRDALRDETKIAIMDAMSRIQRLLDEDRLCVHVCDGCQIFWSHDWKEPVKGESSAECTKPIRELCCSCLGHRPIQEG